MVLKMILFGIFKKTVKSPDLYRMIKNVFSLNAVPKDTI